MWCRLTAVPDPTLEFLSHGVETRWYMPTRNRLTINGNKTVSSNFVQSDFTLTVTTVGQGTRYCRTRPGLIIR